MYKLTSNNGIFWFQDQALAATGLVTHGFSTRLGGVSRPPYTSLNMGLAVGDDLGRVRDNRDRYLLALGISPRQAVSPHFVHSNIVVPVGRAQAGRGIYSYKDAVGDADGLVTQDPGVALFITFADCPPVLFLDPVKKAIGACHAGWRGTAAGIAMETVRSMQDHFGSNPEDILACVGPALDQDHFEVGQDVYDAVASHSLQPDRLLAPNARGRWQFNIWQANVDQLLSAGLAADHISVVEVSTFLRNDLFYSHRRRLGGKTGRMGAVIMLTDGARA